MTKLLASFHRSPLICALTGLCMLLVGLPNLGLGLQSAWWIYRFDTSAVAAQATVTGHTTNTEMGGPHGSRTRYYLRFTYPDESGQTQTAQTYALQVTYQTYPDGSAMPVQFLPGDPSRVRIDLGPEKERTFDAALALLFIGLFFTLPGGVLLPIGLAFHLEHIRLWQRGLKVKGAVESIHDQQAYGRGAQLPYRTLTYSYADPDGHRFTGESLSYRADRTRVWRPGDAIDVSYEAGHPEHSTVRTS